MGTILIRDAEGPHLVPLTASTLVGRHFLCCHPITDPTIHLYWLEIRWVNEAWLWRILAGTERTRGPGVVRDGMWRELTFSKGRGGRIVWDARCSVELVDATPPQLCARDLAAGSWIVEEKLGDVIQEREPGCWVSVDDGQELLDGQVVLIEGRALQVHLPRASKQTDKVLLSLVNPELRLDVDLESLTATVTVDRSEAILRGECVRVLAVFVAERLTSKGYDGGWLTRSEVFNAWVRLGGNSGSPEARMAWERGKLRAQLARQHVADLGGLFETRNIKGKRASRLTVPAERLFLKSRP